MTRAFSLGGFAETAMHHDAALYLPPESELVRRLCRVYEAETGEKAVPKSIGRRDLCQVPCRALWPFGPIFPGDEVREHQPDEYMLSERLLQNTEIIAAAMAELAQ